MPDKDEFTFDDNDGFPDTDLSAAFADGEQSSPEPPPEEPEPPAKKGRKKAKKPKKPKKEKSAQGGGGRSRVLLLVLLLVLAGAGGAYYFMGFGETSPEAPKPAPKAQQAVSLPAKPAPEAAVKPGPKPAAGKPSVAIAPPPKPAEKQPGAAEVTGSQAKPADAKAAADDKVTTKAPAAKASTPTKTVAKVTPPKPKADAAVSAQKGAAKPVAATAIKEKESTSVKPVVKAPLKGSYMIEAGSYMVTSNRDALVKKIRDLGYEPLVAPVDVKLSMIRLRLGSFPENEVKEALDFVRGIEPGAFSVREGGQHVVYAGTFLSKDNVASLQKKFLAEGIPSETEDVEVTRTLSRIRFGGFADEAEAEAVAQKAEGLGIPAKVSRVK